jgi:hypothetical protein
MFNRPTIIPFYAGDVLEKTCIGLMVLPGSLERITVSRTFPVMHSIFFSAKVETS